jgi:hypothetical protein
MKIPVAMNDYAKSVIYKLIDAQEYIKHLYFQLFDNSILSIKAYSDDKTITLYHFTTSMIYPIRYFKGNDIIYEDGAMLEIVHNKNKTIMTTIIPSNTIYNTSSSQFIEQINNFKVTKHSIVSFSLNNISLIHCFNKICHSFAFNDISVGMFTQYISNKYKYKFTKPFELELIDNSFDEHIFKENDTFTINKSHGH